MEWEWMMDLKEQCDTAKVPFFYKTELSLWKAIPLAERKIK